MYVFFIFPAELCMEDTDNDDEEVSSPGKYRQTSNISRTLVGNNIVDHSGVVGA